MKQIKTLSLAEAEIIIQAAREKATILHSPSNIAVVDANGFLLAHIRMDDAQLPSIEHSINKAKTSAYFKKETVELKSDAEPKGDLYGLNNTLDNTVIVFAGGVPVIFDGEVVGAVGVSGGTADQDEEIAKYAALTKI